MNPTNIGTHLYPLEVNKNFRGYPIGYCKYNCGCFFDALAQKSGGPVEYDPYGECPNNPKEIVVVQKLNRFDMLKLPEGV